MMPKFNLGALTADIVYIKPVLVADLPDEVREKAADLEHLFALHNADGQQLALVANKQLAIHLARENHMQPVTVH